MADKDDIQDEIKRRSLAREILGSAAQEMGFAVDSIRHEVIEKGWFGQELTPDVQDQWLRDDSPAPPGEIHGPQDFSRDDLYGQDFEAKTERDQDIER